MYIGVYVNDIVLAATVHPCKNCQIHKVNFYS